MSIRLAKVLVLLDDIMMFTTGAVSSISVLYLLVKGETYQLYNAPNYIFDTPQGHLVLVWWIAWAGLHLWLSEHKAINGCFYLGCRVFNSGIQEDSVILGPFGSRKSQLWWITTFQRHLYASNALMDQGQDGIVWAMFDLDPTVAGVDLPQEQARPSAFVKHLSTNPDLR